MLLTATIVFMFCVQLLMAILHAAHFSYDTIVARYYIRGRTVASGSVNLVICTTFINLQSFGILDIAVQLRLFLQG